MQTMGRGLLACLSALAAGAALAATPAVASDTVGQNYSITGGACGAGHSDMAVQTQSPGNVYAAPYDGVLTSWSADTASWSTATLKVVRVGVGNSFTVLGQDGPRASDGVAYPIRIPLRQGDVLGLFFPQQPGCATQPASAGYAVSYLVTNTDPGIGPGTFTFVDSPSLQFPVTAQIEHDADNDGYGDESQDGCPTDPLTHGACAVPDTTAPETTISKGPKKKTSAKSATFEFSSNEPGSTFECSLDSSGFRPCDSPMTVKAKSKGKHNFLVRARDAAGNLDTSEASYTWKVKKRKKRR